MAFAGRRKGNPQCGEEEVAPSSWQGVPPGVLFRRASKSRTVIPLPREFEEEAPAECVDHVKHLGEGSRAFTALKVH